MLKNNNETKFNWKDLAKAIWFLFGLGGARKRYVVGIILLFIVLFYSVVPPLIVGAVINFFSNYKAGESFERFYFLAGLLGVSMIAVSFLRLTIKQHLQLLFNITAYNIKIKAFELLLSKSLIETTKNTAGEKVQKIQNGADSLLLFFKLLSNQVLSAIASLLGIVIIFIYLRLAYAIFFLAYIVIFFLILKIFTQRLQKLNFERNKAMEGASGVYVEGLSNISTLKSVGSERHFQTRIVEKEKVSKAFFDKIARNLNNQWKTFQFLNGLSAGTFLFFVGRDVLAGVLNIGEIVIFYSYFERMVSVSDQTMNIYNDLIQSKAGIGRMMDIFKQEIQTGAAVEDFPKNWKSIKISDGSFSYKEDCGLKGINIEIKNGEKIGIVGKTGSGKSTLTKVLLGLYPLKQGQFKIGDKDFYSIKLEKRFENISVVPQEIEMFNMTLVENITLFRNIDTDLLQKAIKISQLGEVIENLPQGLDTMIGEKGYKLSGGERQRLAIARAICQNSQILILDEATSSLDVRTEKTIYEALEENFPEKTIIAIAHRTKTLENSNRIYVFEEGRIVKEGKYDELINSEKSFLYNVNQNNKE